jgi:hypothetical protein
MPPTSCGGAPNGFVGKPGAFLPPGSCYWFAGGVSPETPPDIQQRASCVIQIDGDGADYRGYEAGGARFDAAMVALLVSSTAMSEPVVQTVLKQNPGLVGRQVLIAAVPAGNRFVRLEVSLKKVAERWPNDAANSLLSALVDRLRTAAGDSQKAESKVRQAQLANLAEQLASVKKRRDEIGESLRSVRDALGQTGEFFGDPTVTVHNLQSQKRQADMELARLKSRLAAMEDQDQQEAVGAWEAAVKSQEARLSLLKEMSKSGTANAGKIAEQESKLAEAKSQLLTARAQSLTSRRSRGYNLGEPRNLTSSIAEQESRMKQIATQLAKLDAPGMAEKLANYREQQQDEQRLQNEVAELSQRVNVVKGAARERGPLVITVLDGQPR